jgi:hypothetical protein
VLVLVLVPRNRIFVIVLDPFRRVIQYHFSSCNDLSRDGSNNPSIDRAFEPVSVVRKKRGKPEKFGRGEA